MNQNKLSTIINFSNQSNMQKAEKTDLTQYNFAVVLGTEYFNEKNKHVETFPISLKIRKSGELELNGLEQSNINNENVRIYSDKKTTRSKD